MTWLWLVLGAWIGLNVLYVVVRLIVTRKKEPREDRSAELFTLDKSRREHDVRFISLGG